MLGVKDFVLDSLFKPFCELSDTQGLSLVRREEQ